MCGDGLASSRAWWGGGAILSLCGNLSLSQAPWARSETQSTRDNEGGGTDTVDGDPEPG